MSNNSQCVIIHGGAGGATSADLKPAKEAALKEALDSAWGCLSRGDSIEKSCIAAIRILEANEYFDAGYGSYPNEDGKVFVDAGLMCGDGSFVSLMHVPRMRYPSAYALDLLKRGKRLMISWTARHSRVVSQLSADLLERYGVVESDAEMIAPHARKLWRSHRRRKTTAGGGTVGCVVRDRNGKIAACTSTGGLMNKPHGRVGDSPIIGSGVFADDEICGLSTTGSGEEILGASLSGFVVGDIRDGLRLDPNSFSKDPMALGAILSRELKEMNRKYPDAYGGMIVVPRKGDPTFAFNSNSMSIAMRYFDDRNSLKEKIEIASKE